ncbi:MAG: penicillin-binding transpeptidase domain-containing protein, partial [Aquihabitans sp.]
MSEQRNTPRAAVILGVVGVLAVITLVAVLVVWRPSGKVTSDASRPGVNVADPAVVAADAFADGWMAGRLADAPITEATAADVDAKVKLVTAGLATAATAPPQVRVVKVTHQGDGARTPNGPAQGEATATVRVTWALDGGHRYAYDTTWKLREEPLPARAGASTVAPGAESGEQRWAVAFDPDMLLPPHQPGELVRAVRIPAVRGQVLDITSRSLTPGGGTVTIGIKRSRTTDPEGTVQTAARLTAVDPGALLTRVLAASPDEFVEVATLDRAAYELIRAEIQPLPGTVFREQTPPSDLPVNFARGVLGNTGPASEEMAAASNGRLRPGEVTGISGVQQGQDAVLAGTPGLRVEAVATAPGAAPRQLAAWPAVAGKSVVVTLDSRIQAAADAVLSTSGKPSALVAIRVSTGDVLAVANGPAGSSAYNRAMLGRYPPGSVFKVATALGLLERGLRPDTMVNCPATIVVGKRFRNAEGEVLGNVPFREDFAKSCNTAFIGQADKLPSDELSATAERLGYRSLDVGAPVFGGSVPITDNLTEHAA